MMALGTIAKLKLGSGPGTGFGFIRTDDQRHGEPDTFFHKTSLSGGLEFSEQLLEARVEFEVESTSDGRLRAKSVRPAGGR